MKVKHSDFPAGAGRGVECHRQHARDDLTVPGPGKSGRSALECAEGEAGRLRLKVKLIYLNINGSAALKNAPRRISLCSRAGSHSVPARPPDRWLRQSPRPGRITGTAGRR